MLTLTSKLRKYMKIPMPFLLFLALNLTAISASSAHSPSFQREINRQINKNVITSQKEFSNFLFPSFKIAENPGDITSGSGSGMAMSKTSQPQNSVMNSGNWYKIGVTSSGLYTIDFQFLKSLGIDGNSLTKKFIHIYGKPGGCLPEIAGSPVDKDLVENSVYVSGNGNDAFSVNDYVMFYGESPVQWLYSKGDKQFHHQQNAYSDTTYYFLCINQTPGKRMDTIASSGSPDRTITSYNEYQLHDYDAWTDITKNVMSGREWWGEAFDKVQSQDFPFDFPARDPNNSSVCIRTVFASRSLQTTSYDVTCNGNNQFTTSIGPTDFDFTNDYATQANGSNCFNDNSTHLGLNITFNMNGDYNALGWLDFIEVNVRCALSSHNGQFVFRDGASYDSGHVNKFSIASANTNTQVLDVTDIHNIHFIAGSLNGGNYEFNATSDTLRQFATFDGSNFFRPTSFGQVGNQNLHGLPQADMIIISHPNFIAAANRVADFHRKRDNFTVHVVTPQAIYNEFSSGSQDVTAFRDFAKMFYDRAKSDPSLKQIKYVLLMGGASYDPKYRVPNNTNFIPVYETDQPSNSVSYVSSFCSDDFIGFLDDGEGSLPTGNNVDIGVGRFPVTTLDQANAMVDKINAYVDPNSMRDWRNILGFAADDQEWNLFELSTESTVGAVESTYPIFNVDKIYLDAYQMVTTASGERYPDAQKAIIDRVSKGALVMTYTGHGGAEGWAHERVLEVADINAWKNKYAMPVFLTATCEFGRFDDPTTVSAGELCMLNPVGGAIALFTTTRLAESTSNDQLTKGVFNNNIFRIDNGKPRRFGDIMKDSKNAAQFGENTCIFSLLGDPALQIALPQDSVVTTQINQHAVVAGQNDTLRALTQVTIKGYIADASGNKRTGFNGIIYPTVYDKPVTLTTLANVTGTANPSYKMNFVVQNNIIFNGEASVVNGEFTFTFIMPKDVSFTNSNGKISYYATNNKDEDAAGHYNNIIIGGSAINMVKEDGLGPTIHLYINDTTFISGGLCNDTPHLLARLWDDVGINTVGNGIGHDITGVLNGGDPIVMNDYYQSDLDNYHSGWLNYPFQQLPTGYYTLTLKVWDVANNSSEASIDFQVVDHSDFTVEKLFNYPNPFSGSTTFSFEHNADPDEQLEVTIYIYDLQGRMVKTINATPQNGGSHVKTVYWNGNTDGGVPMAQGMYIYRISVMDPSGMHQELNSKLIIIR